MSKRKHPLARCESCSLKRFQYVPGIGPDKASLAVVGEAPGYHEAEQRIPFVGPSGQLLNRVLQHNGIKREDVFVTNAVACRPPDNATPSDSDINCCKPRLVSELQERGVESVLSLGNTPTKSLTGNSGINKLRIGYGKSCADLPGVRIIPTLHPAYVLRAPDALGLLQADVSKISSIAPVYAELTITIAYGRKEALAFIEELRHRMLPKIAVDIETHIDKDTDFGQAHQMGLLCVGIAYDHKKVLVLDEDAVQYPEVLHALRDWAETVPNVVFQNGKFDVKGLYPHCGLFKQTSDTMLMSYCLNEYSGIHKPHGLDFMGQEYLGTPDWKHVLDKYQPKKHGYGVIPRNVLYHYNGLDCDVTFELETLLRKRMEAIDVVKVHDFLIEISNELIFLEMNGIGIDLEHLEVLRVDFEKQLSEIMDGIEALLPKQESYQPASAKKATRLVNLASPAQVKKVFADFGAQVSTTDENMCKTILERRGADSPIGKFITQLLLHRSVDKQKGTYVDGIAKRLYAGRIYSTFLLHGTTTGRLSSRNPNLQNIPRRPIIRNLFVPVRPENVFVQCDYAQAEARIMAWLAGDKYLTPIFNEGERDIFDEITKDLFPHLKKELTPKEEWKELRSKRVKPFFYGIGYGRTEYGLAADPELKMNVPEAREIMRNFTALIPDVMRWQSEVKREVENGNDLVSPFGRHRRFPLITADNHDDVMREALSFVPSSTSSDICLRAMCRVRRDLKGIGWVRNFVHDSILVECHESRVDEVRAVMEGHMLDSGKELTDYVKFGVDTTVGIRWGDM